MSERDAAGLPYTDKDHIECLRREYEESALNGGADATQKCFNFVWALVHSRNRSDTSYGLELIEALLQSDSIECRELLYLKSVGQFRLNHYLDARSTLKSILEKCSDFRQAKSLLESCEAEIVKDGLIGIGAGAAFVGVIAGIAIAAVRKK